MRKTLRGLEQLLSDYQHARILRLTFPHNDAPLSELLVNKLDASEGLSRDFEFTVELLADNATLELKDLQGKMLCVELVRQDGSLRYFTGYVFSFRFVKTDGDVARAATTMPMRCASKTGRARSSYGCTPSATN